MGSLSSQGPRLDCRSEPKEQVQLLSAIYEKHKKRCSTIIIDHVFTDDRIVEAIEKDGPVWRKNHRRKMPTLDTGGTAVQVSDEGLA